MVFVGGRGNIVITTELPVHVFYCIVNIQTAYGIDLSKFIYLPEASVPGVETNPRQRRPVPAVCTILCCDVRPCPGTFVT